MEGESDVSDQPPITTLTFGPMKTTCDMHRVIGCEWKILSITIRPYLPEEIPIMANPFSLKMIRVWFYVRIPFVPGLVGHTTNYLSPIHCVHNPRAGSRIGMYS